jgi:hypothetical protein
MNFGKKGKSTADIPVCSSTDKNVCTTLRKQFINEITDVIICGLFFLNIEY